MSAEKIIILCFLAVAATGVGMYNVGFIMGEGSGLRKCIVARQNVDECQRIAERAVRDYERCSRNKTGENKNGY